MGGETSVIRERVDSLHQLSLPRGARVEDIELDLANISPTLGPAFRYLVDQRTKKATLLPEKPAATQARQTQFANDYVYPTDEQAGPTRTYRVLRSLQGDLRDEAVAEQQSRVSNKSALKEIINPALLFLDNIFLIHSSPREFRV